MSPAAPPVRSGRPAPARGGAGFEVGCHAARRRPRSRPVHVIPARAGIRGLNGTAPPSWLPAYAGMTLLGGRGLRGETTFPDGGGVAAPHPTP